LGNFLAEYGERVSPDLVSTTVVEPGGVVTHAWDPQTYLTFAHERSRPFFDLLARVGAEAPASVVDLGCGPGNLTAALLRRWPGARVLGVDSSAEMVAEARRLSADGLTFEVADLSEFRPARPIDVVVSNATLQWVPGHLDLLADLVGWIAPGGWLGFQVPGNFDAPSHALLHRLAADPRFAPYTADVARPASHDPETYLERLLRLGLRAEVWETTYLHVLQGPDPVLRWVSGTGARPVLQALPDALRRAFEEEYAAALRTAYPAREFGTVLPFRRVFAVAHKPG
jgi:trans-aconitate 2-methyltransferase